ncbi:hypothetical protein ACFHWS_07840 [Micromonospora sp. LOL_013]|uniref:hypothetical protein n=1 Tax=Micromonospora sp. LOL_013 TaxID=3345414 RepID=UPI003A89D65B
MESLLQADRPDLPRVHGPVEPELAAAYWSAGLAAAPLHLDGTTVADLVDGRMRQVKRTDVTTEEPQ